MICLPGILSQGGEKYTWGRYNAAYGPKAGTAATVSRNPTNTTYAADAYTISGSSFKLESPKSTQFQNLTVGKKTVNISNSNTSTSSGSTLYEVTKNSGVTSWTESTGSYGSQITMTYNSNAMRVKGIKFDSSTGLFSSGSSDSFSLNAGNIVYTNNMTGNSLDCSSFSGVKEVRKIEIISVNFSEGTVQARTATISAVGSNVKIDYIPYTLGYVRGDFIETVRASEGTYPDNGKQGDYWYVRYSDTPITWERYAMTEAEVQGESVTNSYSSSTYLYRATSYSRSGKTFTATGTRTRASSLAVGNYLIQSNGAFVNSTSMSGDTLFKITGKSGSSTVSLTFDTYTVGDVKGSYVDSVTSYNPYEFPDDGAQDGYWYVKIS